MTTIRRLWSWLTTTTRESTPIALCFLGATMIGAAVHLEGHPIGTLLVFLAGGFIIASALDLTAREATANERARWAAVLLDALKEDRNLEITVTTTHIGKGDDAS